MELDWDERLELGDDYIDVQHRMLVTIMNRLAKMIEKGVSQELMTRTMHEIRKYAEFHFASEESFMYEIEFPGLQRHETIHSRLLQELSIRIGRVIHQHHNGEEVLSYLYSWLVEHVEREDSQFIAYYRKHHMSRLA